MTGALLSQVLMNFEEMRRLVRVRVRDGGGDEGELGGDHLDRVAVEQIVEAGQLVSHSFLFPPNSQF